MNFRPIQTVIVFTGFRVLPVICLAFSRISSGPGCAECFNTPVFKQLLIINGHPAAKNGRDPKLLASIGRLGAVGVVHNAFQINARVKRSILFDQVVQITQKPFLVPLRCKGSPVYKTSASPESKMAVCLALRSPKEFDKPPA